LGCGKRDNQGELIRLSLTHQGQLILDRIHGRGGYLHRSASCWQSFLTRKGQYRAFHAEVDRAAKEKLIELLKDRDWE
jgi:predicted RNA-binding protein YlxR (DUF448 family)